MIFIYSYIYISFLFRNVTTVEAETNRQLLLKLKKNEYGELTTSAIQNDTNEYINGHNNSLNIPPTKQENNKSPIQPHITNMLSNLNDDKQWNNNNHQINSNQISQQTTTNR